MVLEAPKSAAKAAKEAREARDGPGKSTAQKIAERQAKYGR